MKEFWEWLFWWYSNEANWAEAAYEVEVDQQLKDKLMTLVLACDDGLVAANHVCFHMA